MKAAFVTIIIGHVLSQTCKPDLLIDDFAKIDRHDYEGALRYFNLVGGDYGEVGITSTYDTKNKRVELLSTAADNFWFAKFDLNACFDLTGYTAIQFDFEAPKGTNASFTLTQKSKDCVDRLVDSEYIELNPPASGVKQVIVQPLQSFAKNLNGTLFDFVHLKDWTLVGLKPVGTKAYFSNFILKGNCSALGSASTTTTLTTATSTPTSSRTNSDLTTSPGLLALIASFILGLI
jgi:hypothetical protein